MAKRRQRIKKKKQDLLSTYSDPRAPEALGGLCRFARAQRLSHTQERDALRKSLAFTLHCPPRRQFKMAPVMTLNIDQQWVADLVEMQRYWRQNRGVRYLVTLVDVLSKYAWVRPITHKTGAELLKAFESIVAEGCRPQTLQTDKGKEFYNTTLQRWLKKEGIRHFSTLGDAKASIVERFNRTLKSRVYRYFTAVNTTQYFDILPSLVQRYNEDVHVSGWRPRT